MSGDPFAQFASEPPAVDAAGEPVARRTRREQIFQETDAIAEAPRPRIVPIAAGPDDLPNHPDYPAITLR